TFAISSVFDSVFFFFQAEDGIRDKLVTGVQTCALPIFALLSYSVVTGQAGVISLCQISFAGIGAITTAQLATNNHWPGLLALVRSEERRVGKEGRCRGGA